MLQLVPALEGGGVERGTVEIAAAIARAGGRALVASAGGRMEAALAAAGGELRRLPLAAKSPLALPGLVGALRHLLRAEGVDILHARSRFPAWAGLIAARAEGRAFVTTYHGTYGEGGIPLKRLYNSVMARGRPTIAISDWIAAHVAARHGLPPGRIVTIPRGADLAVFDPAAVTEARRAALRAAWAIGDDPRPLLLLPGRLTRWKGQALLLEALARLPRHEGRLPVRTVLAGGPLGTPYAAELARAAAALGPPGEVVLAGHVEDMAAALALADLVLCPSTEPEAFGRAAAEAGAMARPVIAADHGGAREVVEAGRSGWLVAPGDAGALAHAIREALALPPAARAALGAAARARIAARFSVAAMQAATLAVYRRVLAGEWAGREALHPGSGTS